MNLGFPLIELTGLEKSLKDLIQPDERFCNGYRQISIEHLQAPYLKIESTLPTTVPQKLRERIIITRKLATYGYFVYEFQRVSMFWAASCIEMALKFKFDDKYPDPVEIVRRASDQSTQETCRIQVERLKDYRRQTPKWQILGMPVKDFDYSFKALLKWVFEESFLPEDILIPVQEMVNGYCHHKGTSEYKHSAVMIEELPKFRNRMAHPKNLDRIVTPNEPLETYLLLVDVATKLWGES